jgi:hypothetical protein
MWLFSLLLLALTSYARISLCLVCGTESGQYKVKPIMADWSSLQSHFFSSAFGGLTFTSPTSTYLFFILEFFQISPIPTSLYRSK